MSTAPVQRLTAMRRANVKTIVFSCSATVYGDPASVPIREDFPRSATNPYGRSKLIIEDILADQHRAGPDWRIARLRYFNPVGAHESGLSGEDPKGIPNNLMPFVAQVAVGKREYLNVWGDDYPTPDGTGERDYIHVVDLAEGHVAALNYHNKQGGLLTVILGTGQGYSVLDMVKAFEHASGRPIPFEIARSRTGDIAQCWADPSLAHQLLGWLDSQARSRSDVCRCLALAARLPNPYQNPIKAMTGFLSSPPLERDNPFLHHHARSPSSRATHAWPFYGRQGAHRGQCLPQRHARGSPSGRLRPDCIRLRPRLAKMADSANRGPLDAIGAIHETTEIITHSPAPKPKRPLLTANAIGALIGVAIQQIMQKAITQ